MATTAVKPSDPSLAEALRLAALFAVIKILLHVAANLWQTHLGYQYFADEMYFLVCGRHLAWGYVDHGPVVALQARLAETFFGASLNGIRIFSTLAGAARIVLTGLLAWALGGRRTAQILAMICILFAPVYLMLDGYLSMNSFESIFWMGILLCVVLILRGASRHLWLFVGLLSGIGLLNKPSMIFFLVALTAALAVSPQRHTLRDRSVIYAVLLAFVITLPNLAWQVHHHWPTLEFLRNSNHGNRGAHAAVLPFLIDQVLILQSLSVVVWCAGLGWLLLDRRARQWRWLGLTYLFLLAIMLLLHAKSYYVAPIYPMLFAAGGIAWEQHFSGSRRSIIPLTLAAAIAVIGIIFIPASIPILSPAAFICSQKALHQYPAHGYPVNRNLLAIPQGYADRLGWTEEADQVTHIYAALPQGQPVTIFSMNYTEASALNILSHDLPQVISAHNNYFLWGADDPSLDRMLVLGGSPGTLRALYESVEPVGTVDRHNSMPSEPIYLVSGRRLTPTAEWLSLKRFQ